jgi:hypothetical protein
LVNTAWQRRARATAPAARTPRNRDGSNPLGTVTPTRKQDDLEKGQRPFNTVNRSETRYRGNYYFAKSRKIETH